MWNYFKNISTYVILQEEKKLKFKETSKLYYIYLLILTFITTLSFNSNPFSNTVLNHDSGMFQYFGYAMNKGLVIYRDIFDHKGPVIFLINYISVLLGNYGLYIVEFIFMYIFLLYGYKLSSLYLKNNKTKLLAVSIMSLLTYYIYDGGNTVEGYAVVFIMISLYIFSKYYIYNYVSDIEIIVLGICFSLVALIRINMISLWVIFVISIIIELLYTKKFKELLNHIFYFSLGSAIIFLPIIIYLYLNSALYEFFYQSILFNIFYIGDGEGLINVIKFFTSKVPILMMILILGIFIGVTKINKYIVTIYFSITLTIVSILLSNRPYQHYVIVILPFVLLSLTHILKQFNITYNLKSLIATIIIISPLLIDNLNLLIAKNLQTDNKAISNFNEARVFASNNLKYKENINLLSEYIKENTNEEDYIYTHRMSGNIYLTSNRLSNTKFFALPAADITDINKLKYEFFSDMHNKKAKIIIVRKNFIESKQLGFEKEFKEYLLTNYNKKKEISNYYIYE